ncbi:MAG: glyoxalase [Bacteroidetes bacterium]|nr:MAG: glyoxalase [Bacteroidota bacterium]
MKTRNLSIRSLFLLSFLAAFTLQSPAQVEYSTGSISVGLIVEDVQKSVDFYTHVLGMKEVSPFQVDAKKATELGLSNGKAFDVRVLKTRDSDDASQWKIMSFKNKSKVCKEETVPDANGLRYITLFVESMTPVVENCKKHKVDFLGKTPSTLNEVLHFILIRDPDGNFIEVIGPK